MYGITANRPGRDGQVPTFYLNEHVQGIVSEAHAATVAASVLIGFNRLVFTGMGEAGTYSFIDEHGQVTHIGVTKL